MASFAEMIFLKTGIFFLKMDIWCVLGRYILDMIRNTVLFKILMRGLLALSVAAVSVVMAAPASADEVPQNRPVIVAGGAFYPQFTQNPLRDAISRDGRDVHVFTIDNYANLLEENSAQPLEKTSVRFAAFVEDVLERTGATQVDIVAHSQSALLTQYFIKRLNGADRVNTVVTLSSITHGSQLGNFALEFGDLRCLQVTICEQLSMDSEFIRSLTIPSDAAPGVRYVNFTSRNEEASFPFENNFMTGPGDVTNVLLQDQCPRDFAEHLMLPLYPPLIDGTVQALRGSDIALKCLF